MALFDHRVFKIGQSWWAAQVHSGGGAGYGEAKPRITHNTVFFSSLADEKTETRLARIPAGWLNRLSHRALIKLFEEAESLGSHFPMSPYNAPSAEELGGPVYVDDEGLRWAARPTHTVNVSPSGHAEVRAAVEFVCLDDSALRKEIQLGSATNFQEFRAQYGDVGVGELIKAVKGTFLDYEPEKRVLTQ